MTDAGAASGAGTNYTGAVFCTPDGRWPDEKHAERIERAFDSAGIKVSVCAACEDFSAIGRPFDFVFCRPLPDVGALAGVV